MSERLRETQKDRGSVWRLAPFTFASAVAATGPLLFGLAGCASSLPRAPAAAVGAPAGPGGPAYATVDAVRPIPPDATDAPGADPQDDILAAMGVAVSGGGAAAEIVVRMDDGETLSVVQANAAGLAAGQRVVVVPGAIPRLIRLDAPSPAS